MLAASKKRLGPDAINHEMRAALGETLDAWSIVVAHVCAIFVVAVSAKKYAAAAAALATVRSFEDQLKMTDAALSQTFSDRTDILSDWKASCGLVRTAQRARNKLAHGKLVPVVVEGGGIEFRFLPSFHFFTHKDRDGFEHLTLADLKSITGSVRNAIGALSKFGKTIGARQEVSAPARIFKSGSSKIVRRVP